MSQETTEHFIKAWDFFIYHFFELAFLFLLVSFFVEIINLYVNPEKIKKLLSSNKSGYLIASGLGAITPFCSCSTIPLTLGLLKARVSFGPIMTFLFTSPLLNPIVVVVFWSAFGPAVTIVYALIAFVVSILAGITLEKLGFEKYVKKEIFQDDIISCSTTDESTKSCCSTPEPKTLCCSTPEPISSCCSTEEPVNMFKPMSNPKPNGVFNMNANKNEPIKKQSKLNIKEAKYMAVKVWKQFFSFVHYIIIGIAIGAIIHGFVPTEVLTRYAGADNYFAIPIAAIIGIPLYIRAVSMVGLAPALIAGGVSMGAILALTIAGAGASLPEMIMLKKIFKLPIMIFFVFIVFLMAISCGYLVNIYFM